MGDNIKEQCSIVEKMREAHLIDSLCALSYVNEGEHMSVQNLIMMALKTRDTSNIYAFAGLHYHLPNQPKDAEDYLSQVKRYHEMGFDGIKRVESIPWIRKLVGDIPMDSPVYDGFYEYLQKNQIPIFWHVGDPETYWSEEDCPQWAKDKGWTYYDGSYIGNAQMYGEIDIVLERYPKLRIVFDHFYFLSGDLDRAAKFLDKWETVYFTFSPGCEMFYNFSEDPNRTKEFFIKYQDRLMHGTDLGYSEDEWEETAQMKLKEADNTIKTMRRFFETNDTFIADPKVGSMWNRGDDTLTGIGLDNHVLRKIYVQNYMKFIARNTRRINYNKLLEYANELRVLFTKVKPNEKVAKQIEECIEIFKGAI